MANIQKCGNNYQFDQKFIEKNTSTANIAGTVWFSLSNSC